MKSKLNARSLRYLLFIGLIMIITFSAVAFTYGYNLLNGYASETGTLNARANITDQNVANLKKVQQYLTEHSQEIARAKSIVAESKKYQYQDDIIKDISRYAAETNVQLLSFTFTSGNSGASGAGTAPAQPAPSATPTPAPTTATPQPTAGSPAPATGSVKSTTADIAIKSPVDYKNLLSFIRRIESSPMKMQIGSIGLTRSDSEPNKVTSQSFVIEVYIR